MRQVGIADAMQKTLDHASKYALERDNGQRTMIPTVAGIVAVAGACGASFGFGNLIWGHTQLDEEVNKETNKHHVAAPSPSFCKASSARVLKSYNLPQVCPLKDEHKLVSCACCACMHVSGAGLKCANCHYV